jgi:hypothetical protein
MSCDDISGAYSLEYHMEKKYRIKFKIEVRKYIPNPISLFDSIIEYSVSFSGDKSIDKFLFSHLRRRRRITLRSRIDSVIVKIDFNNILILFKYMRL